MSMISSLKGRVNIIFDLINLADIDMVYRGNYDTLARATGYKNRSGVWKLIKHYIRLGIVTPVKDGLRINIGVLTYSA